MPDTPPRTALVTGGTGALGSAVCAVLLDAGWDLVVPWVREEELDRVPRDDPRVRLVEADLFDPGAARACVEAAGPGLGAVVNLVGGFAAGQPVASTPVDDFEAQFRLNLRPTYLVTQAALPVLESAGGGSIVCVSSRSALRPFAGAAGYCAAKAAVSVFARVVAEEGRASGVRCNAILPSMIDTPLNREAMGADKEMVPPAQIGRVIAFLLSDAAAPITGAEVPVYGNA